MTNLRASTGHPTHTCLGRHPAPPSPLSLVGLDCLLDGILTRPRLLHRYCQLLCEKGPEHDYAAAGAFNDPGTPEGDSWAMWKETLNKMTGDAA